MRTKASPRQFLDDVGGTVRAARTGAGWSQRELSRRSGVSQAQICRIETGRVRDLRISDVDRLFVALGVRYSLRTEFPHLMRTPSDVVHAVCSVYATRRLGAKGWAFEREVEIGGDRGRGWIDILAFHPGSRLLLVIEVKTEIQDIGAIERSLNWYEREAPRAARRFGWRPAAVATVLLVLDSRANDGRVVASGPGFALAFPGRAPELHEVIDGQALDRNRRFLAMIDPRTRRSTWLRATRSDGRRTPAAYDDYIDAARRLERQPAPRRPG